MTRRKDDAARGSIEHDSRARMWPGITAGFDARCSCTWAMHDGVYQVKLRDAQACPSHAGDLATVVARMARLQAITPEANAGDGGRG